MRRIYGLILLVVLSVTCPPGMACATPTRTISEHYAGWAAVAYPEMDAADMEAMVQRMVDAGANVLWIGHNNPGVVDLDKVEPGLSYAVYEAFQDPDDPRHEDAGRILAAQYRLLEACRAVGVKAVLPVGYQIQMGTRWNSEHADSLRRDATGEPLDIYGGGVSASFYAPAYRRDIKAYYRWVDAQFVRPYADVILMLNLADEPLGGDYSAPADAEFRRRHGFGLAEVDDDPHRQRLLGQFQSEYIVDYAIFGARFWETLHPGLAVTMSFDGAQARQTFTMPTVEALFRDTPDNFVVTFDAYPRDGLPNVPLSDQNLVGLFLLARSAGLYSARYGKPLWLWPAANSWGLSQASSDPGTVSDAIANGIYLALLVRQSGGYLQGMAYWNYNVKEQGLYNDSHDTAYDVETMFSRVSANLPTLRQLMTVKPSSPDVLLLVPHAWAYEQIGAQRSAVLLEVQPFRRLAMLARTGVPVAVVSSLEGWSMESVQTVIVWTPSEEHLAPQDWDKLRGVLARGGRVVASPQVGSVLTAGSKEAPVPVAAGFVERQGSVYVAQQGIAVLFEDQRHEALAPFWAEVLGLTLVQPGYWIETSGTVFGYHLGPDPVEVHLSTPFLVIGWVYDDRALVRRRVYGTGAAVVLGRREYVFLVRDWWPGPWVV